MVEQKLCAAVTRIAAPGNKLRIGHSWILNDVSKPTCRLDFHRARLHIPAVRGVVPTQQTVHLVGGQIRFFNHDVTDILSGPPDLLAALDQTLLLPRPHLDWDF